MSSTIKSISANILEKTYDAKTVEETRQMRFIISTAAKDRGKEVINMDNWQLEKYAMNPIVGYQHDLYGAILSSANPDYVIGKSVVALDTFKGKKILAAEATFEPEKINPLAEKVFQKLLFGSLNAASVGILPIGEGKYNKEEKTYNYDGQELLEWSVVNIPMNGEARRYSMQKSLVEEAISEIIKDEKLRKQFLDAINSEHGGKEAEQTEKEISGADPDLNRWKERFNKIKKKNG
jgi:hypothetical protein